ncbi:MAG: hypothetical protein JXJ04_03945 [Spirochaetales bacterium]|nr:hypothetical protein [Spirochaetales bacterium]
MEVIEENGKNRLIAGIQADARKEAEQIIAKAQSSMLERKKSIDIQISRIQKEAETKAKEQVEIIRKNAKSAIAVEKKRLSLRIMDSIVNAAIDKAKDKLHALIDTPAYSEILVNWIVEAAIGLNVDEAAVNASIKEMKYITEDLLKKAVDILFSLTGKKVVILKSADNPLLAQGIILTSKNGRTAFNNQILTRILRYQSEVRKMIYNILNKENK